MKPSCLVSEDNTYTQSFSRYNIFTTCNKEDMWYWYMDLSIWNCHWYTLGSIEEHDSESCSVSKLLLQNSDSSSSLPFFTQHMLQCCQSLKGSQGTSDGYETYKSVPFELNPFKSERIRWCRLQTARPTTEWCQHYNRLLLLKSHQNDLKWPVSTQWLLGPFGIANPQNLMNNWT